MFLPFPSHQDLTTYSKNLITICAIVNFTIIGLGVFYLIARFGFYLDNELESLFRSVVLALTVVNAVALVSINKEQNLFLQIGLCLATLLVVFAISMLGSRYAVLLSVVMLIFNLSVFYQFLKFFRIAKSIFSKTHIFLFVIIVLTSIGYAYSGSVFLPEQILFGDASMDVLIHLSLVNMLETYNIISEGGDGLTPTRYHIGSHWILLHLSRYVGQDASYLYAATWVIIFQPLFIFFLLKCFLDLNISQPNGNRFDLHKKSTFSLFCILLLAALAEFKFNTFVLFRGESYTLGLTFLFLCFPLFYKITQSGIDSQRWKIVVIKIIYMQLLILLTFLFKFNVFFMFQVAFFYVLWVRFFDKPKLFFPVIIIWFAITFGMLSLAYDDKMVAMFADMQNIDLWIIEFNSLSHYFLWLLLFVWLYSVRSRSLGSSFFSIRPLRNIFSKYNEIILISVLLVSGFLVLAALHFGEAGLYFLQFFKFFVVLLCSSYVMDFEKWYQKL